MILRRGRRATRQILIGLSLAVITAPSVYAYDSITNTISVGSNPYSLAISPDGTFAYVGNYSGSSISRINLTTNATDATITLPNNNPREIAFTSNGAFAYICDGSKVIKVRTSDNTIVATINTGATWGIAIAPNGQFAYVTSGTANIYQINLSDDSFTTYSGRGTALNGVSFAPDGLTAYIADYTANTILKVRTSDTAVLAYISVTSPWSVAISPDGTYGITAGAGTDSMRRFSTSTNQITYTYSTSVTQGVSFPLAGHFVYVADRGASRLLKINPSTNSVTQVATITSTSYYVAMNPSGTVALVPNFSGNSVSRLTPEPGPTGSSITITSQNSVQFRSSITVSASLGVAGTDGKVTYFANGKKIPNCINKFSTSLASSCTFKPSLRGSMRITATLNPTNSLYVQSTSNTINLSVVNRSSNR